MTDRPLLAVRALDGWTPAPALVDALDALLRAVEAADAPPWPTLDARTAEAIQAALDVCDVTRRLGVTSALHGESGQ